MYYFSLLLLASLAQAHPTILPRQAGETCVYACPSHDAHRVPLISRPGALGPLDTQYSIIQCIYAPVNWENSAHTCSFDKIDGRSRLGVFGDGCPPKGLRVCSPPKEEGEEDEDDAPPLPAGALFSSQKDGKDLTIEPLASMKRMKQYLDSKSQPSS
ncbi:hypothetical protein BKA70DRAFT_756456 [Coprinopsis sp. MPI-PUGE-AT-0042]|nr:hypothetical protein BKA70DRAFT_756456 [Coprinopsis sp. MPI-PUGE-AT-0042]